MLTKRHNAFILLIVLLVLAVAGTALAVMARRHAGLALEAAEDTRGLQLDWGARSLREALLPKAGGVLDAAQRPYEEPVTAIDYTLDLGGTAFRLRLGDEQSRANVNLLAEGRSKTALAETVRRLDDDRLGRRPVRLRPSEPERAPLLGPPRLYDSFAQVFRTGGPEALFVPDDAGASVRRLTCWGDGRVNLLRADDGVLRETLEGLLDNAQVARIVACRRDRPGTTLTDILKELELDRKVTRALRSRVTDRSACHSLWLAADDGVRTRTRLYVAQSGDLEIDSRVWSYRW